MEKHNQIYRIYHPDKGIVIGTRKEFISTEPRFKSTFSHFVKGRPNRLYGWILEDNLDRVNLNYLQRNRNLPRKFYCPEEGIVEATISEFYEKHIKDEGGTYVNISCLCSGVIKTLYNKWVLAENKDKYEDLIRVNKPKVAKPIKIAHLYHPEHGTHLLSRKEFLDRFGLDKQSVTDLVTKRRKNRRGWKLVE